MLARLQRGILILLTLAACAWLLLWWRAGHPWLAVLGALLIAFAYTFVLAGEFLLLAAVHGDDPTPRARPLQLLKAWWDECVIDVLVFGWRQPFLEHAVADVPTRPGRRGLLFLHGYVCNRALWAPWLERCRRLDRPALAISLEPVFSGLDAYVSQVERAVARLERETGLAPIVVCHSMGGLVLRAWLAETPGALARVRHVVTIGTPHSGTWLARLSRTANALHMRSTSDWLQSLAAREPAELGKRFTCFYSQCDNIVFPPCVATLAGADNRHVAATAHVALAFHPEVVAAIEQIVAEAGDATP
jgi:triacylglycerol lipase